MKRITVAVPLATRAVGLTVQYRKKGSDPINGLNYPITFSIRATSPTTAVLVMYSYSGQGGIGGL